MTRLPPAPITRVAGPAIRSISAFEPTATKRSPRTAKAAAFGRRIHRRDPRATDDQVRSSTSGPHGAGDAARRRVQNGEKFVVELSNATLTNIEGFLARRPGPDAHHQSRRSRADDDGREDARGPDRRRHGDGRGRREHPQEARLHDGRLRSAVRDPSRHQGQGRAIGEGRCLRDPAGAPIAE